MARTYFQDFKRGDGTEVTVEYTFNEGSAPSYSPYSGADSGDPCDVSIVKAFDDNGDVEYTEDETEAWEEYIIGHHITDYDEDWD